MDGVKGIFYNRRYPNLFLRNTVIGRSGRDFLVPGDSGAVVVDEVGQAPYNMQLQSVIEMGAERGFVWLL
jgi:hypothetical protein